MKTQTKQELVIDLETTGLQWQKDSILGVAMYFPENNNNAAYLEAGSLVLRDGKEFLIGHGAKFDAKFIYKVTGELPYIHYDTGVAYYLLHINKSWKLENILFDVLGLEKEDLLAVYNHAKECKCVEEGKKFKEAKKLPPDWWTLVDSNVLGDYAKEDVTGCYKIKTYCDEQFTKNPTLKAWFEEIEMPFMNILAESEIQGVKLNLPKLKLLQSEYEQELAAVEKTLHWMIGDVNQEVNFGSPPQLQKVLYETLKLPKGKKNKTGWSTDAATLEKLKDKHAFPKLLLKYRGLAKLLSTYIIGLQERVDANGYVHTTYNQLRTKTRRLSSEDPNLQNIPAKTERGKRVRAVFIPSPGCAFIDCDFSQIEPRLLAHFSGDPLLIQWYKEGQDIYNNMTEKMIAQGFSKFDRSASKILVLSAMYGKTPWGLAQTLNCSVPEAEAILKGWFDQFPAVREYIDTQIEECKLNDGWIKTLAGLDVFVENINSSNDWWREAAERECINYRIQSSSQDILKCATVDIKEELNRVFCLSVHDQLIHDVPLDVAKEEAKRIKAIMENAYELVVPLKVDCKITDHWVKE